MADRRWSTVELLALAFVLLILLFQSVLGQLQPLNNQTERAALLDLRSSLGLRAKDWPRKADPCSVWTGVQCRDGRVVGINISGLRRTRVGRLNPQFSVDGLANLTLLASFNTSGFLLPGSIPDWFGQRLHSLQVLDLRSCSVIDPIPSSLGNLTTLNSLYLSKNNLTSIIPPSLGQLLNLSVLDLSQNLLTGSIPSSFSALTNLTLLDLSSNFLSGSIPPALGTLSTLRFLNLSSNSLSADIPAQFGGLSSLVELDLGSNSLSGSLPPDLRGMGSLQKMSLSNNFLAGSLQSTLFSGLTLLHFVVLSHNNFSGNLPVSLWSMPQLRLLDVSRNNFTGILPNRSSNANVTLSVFNLSDNQFYGSLTSLVGRFRFIDLSANYFEGIVPIDTLSNVSIANNCLQNESNQRSLEDCSFFYAQRGLRFDNFGGPNTTQPPSSAETSKNNGNLAPILGGVFGGLGFILILVSVLALILLRRKNGVSDQRGSDVGPAPAGSSPPPPGVSINFSSLGDAYTYEQLLQATRDFSDSNFIKHGHSGDLFQGVLEGGVIVVVKRIDVSSVKKESYMRELDFLSRVSDTRLVPLLGHCLEQENEKFLVYKYMPNKDLSSSLYRKTNFQDDLQSLDWITRLKIAIGAADGLSYLHHECCPPIVHRDVQASSILLDDKFEVRLGSLSEVCTQEGDTHQNVITRFLRLPQTSGQGPSGSLSATCASDVYCFGKVLLELVTGKMGISASDDASVKDWLEQTLPYISTYEKELVTKIVDPSLIVDEDLLEEVWAMAIVARSCLNPKPSKRPIMRYILKALENPLKVVREENSGSAPLRTTSSRRSWNAALFGSWRHSSLDIAAIPSAIREGSGVLKQSGTAGSNGSGQAGGFDHSFSRKMPSKEIFPEPDDFRDLERPEEV
ncbi:probable LRR receptor-like serine/threonine-protein kinase At2g16250 [Macadamia integrifolia]|uniref:probable LRR receptor-like serine/threonine-protein kinase At2g16250 n=1 Tax=Macadamia integrifolia TaxID=60698 RepID=UPI001C4FB261|nr:probable LRR receptor-like serine/threonine-protein kinase At2g16250 [Macadamia integrifolia]XP_042508589.1 probable LRR receptor-like serine/threonine-protein kinase At2g16250 [Macadamia integrifolia]